MPKCFDKYFTPAIRFSLVIHKARTPPPRRGYKPGENMLG